MNIFYKVFLGMVLIMNAQAQGKSPQSCPIDSDLWILGGQSNMQGAAEYKPAVEDKRIMMFNMTDNTWIVAQEPIHRIYGAAAGVHKTIQLGFGETEKQYDEYAQTNKKTPFGAVGPGLPFAQHLVANGVKAIGLIPCAHGGSSMDQWSPSLKDQGDNSLYGAMMNRIKMVDGKIKGVLWYQGESDCGTGVCDLYEQKMLNFIDTLRKDVNDPNLPFILVQIGRYYCTKEGKEKDDAMTKVRDVQRLLPTLRKNVYCVSALDLPLSDVIHISYDGQQMLGKRLGEIALTYVYKKAGHAKQINLESVEVNNTQAASTLKLRFSGVTGKLSALGRPADFSVKTGEKDDGYLVSYCTEFDASEPNVVILKSMKPFTETTKLIYGYGMTPYVNITDEKDIPISAFGPIDLPIKK
jgi:sialate O-acetylesterase